VTDSINYLIDVCTSAAPGQKECDNAIRKIQSMRPLLDNPTEPHNDSTYFECLDTVMEKSKSLGEFIICLFLNAYVVGVVEPYI
jgi:talin